MSTTLDKMPSETSRNMPIFIQSSPDLSKIDNLTKKDSKSKKDPSSKKVLKEKRSKSQEKPVNGHLVVNSGTGDHLVASNGDLVNAGQLNPYMLRTITTRIGTKSAKREVSEVTPPAVSEPQSTSIAGETNMPLRNTSHYGQAYIQANPRSHLSSQRCLVTSREIRSNPDETW